MSYQVDKDVQEVNILQGVYNKTSFNSIIHLFQLYFDCHPTLLPLFILHKMDHFLCNDNGIIALPIRDKVTLPRINKLLHDLSKSCCCNLSFDGRATRDSRVRLPRKENVQSRHQHLFEENVRKNQKGSTNFKNKKVRELITCVEGINTPRVHLKGRQPLIK